MNEQSPPTTNGLFVAQAEISATLKNIIRQHLGARGKQLAADQIEAVDVLCSNIAAIINGDSDNPANWQSMSAVCGVVFDRLMGRGQYQELADYWNARRAEEQAKQKAENND